MLVKARAILIVILNNINVILKNKIKAALTKNELFKKVLLKLKNFENLFIRDKLLY
jgi:hypothetical protein